MSLGSVVSSFYNSPILPLLSPATSGLNNYMNTGNPLSAISPLLSPAATAADIANGGNGDPVGDVVNGFLNNPSDNPHRYNPLAGAGFGSGKRSWDYFNADLAKAYGMDQATAYQEALSNTSYQRAVNDLKAAGLNPVLAMGKVGGADVFGGASMSTGGGFAGGRRNSSGWDLKKIQTIASTVATVVTTGAKILGALGI